MDRSKLKGKNELSEARSGVDLSGRDFNSVYMSQPLSLSHSFLNGVSISDSIFFDADINQTEMAEAYFNGCYFYNVNLSGADLVGSTFIDCKFYECSFTEGEWRSSKFTNVEFDECDFDYTTINLCVFENCKFPTIRKGSLSHKSVNYNVFTKTYIGQINLSESVVANNFGMLAPENVKSLANVGNGISIEEVCLKSGSGNTNAFEIVSAITKEFDHDRNKRLKKLKLEFMSNIISSLCFEKKYRHHLCYI